MEASVTSEKLRESLKLLEAGRLPEAEFLCRQVLSIDSNRPMAKGLLGFIAHRQGRDDEAERLLLEAAGSGGDVSQIQHLLGLYYAERGSLRQAAERFKLAVQRDPRHLKAWLALGEVCKRLGRQDAAYKAFTQACQVSPESLQAHVALAASASEIGRSDEAHSVFSRVLQADPFNAQAHFGLANLYRAAGQSARAIDHYHQALDSDPSSVPTYINLGGLLQDEGRVEEAAVAFRKATQLRPDFAPAHFNLGNAYLADGRLREAEEAIGRSLFLDDRFAPAHNNLGVLLLKQGREDEALSSFRRSLEIDPDQVDARRNIANIKKSRGELESAIDDYRQLLTLSPDDPEINLSLGEVLVMAGKGAEALSHIDVKLAQNPTDAGALSLKGAALAVMGDQKNEAFLVDYEHLIGRREIDELGNFESLDALNAALAEHVASQPVQREDKTTVHGLETDEVLGGDEPAVVLIRDFICRVVQHRIEHIAVDRGHPFALGRPRKYRLNTWGVQMRQKGHQVAHIHPNAWLSGVYYVKLPRAVDSGEGSQEGWIEFGKGIDRLFRHADPRTLKVRPKEGLLLTFPSYFWHRTIPFDTDEDRISIGFDVIPDDSVPGERLSNGL